MIRSNRRARSDSNGAKQNLVEHINRAEASYESRFLGDSKVADYCGRYEARRVLVEAELVA